MLSNDLNQPGRERNSAPTGGTLGERLEAGLPAHFNDGANYPESPLIEIDCINAEARCLTPSQSGAARRGDDRAVPIRHDREQDGHQFLAGDDPFVGVVSAPWWLPDVFAGIESQQAVGYSRSEHSRSELVTLGNDIG
jgi:hypothetical protein